MKGGGFDKQSRTGSLSESTWLEHQYLTWAVDSCIISCRMGRRRRILVKKKAVRISQAETICQQNWRLDGECCRQLDPIKTTLLHFAGKSVCKEPPKFTADLKDVEISVKPTTTRQGTRELSDYKVYKVLAVHLYLILSVSLVMNRGLRARLLDLSHYAWNYTNHRGRYWSPWANQILDQAWTMTLL